MTRVDGVRRTAADHADRGGSIPASTLHLWIDATDEAIELVERFHYSHRWPSNVQFVVTAHETGGLFGNRGRALAAVAYTIPPTRWSEDVWELARLVRRDDSRLPLSFLVSQSLRLMRKKTTANLIVSFADWTQRHHGGIYQACGWNYDGQRAPSMDGVIVDGTFIPGRSANSRWNTRSPRRLAENGITAEPHFDAGKHLYWKALNASGEQKAQRLGLQQLAYPKPHHGTVKEYLPR